TSYSHLYNLLFIFLSIPQVSSAEKHKLQPKTVRKYCISVENRFKVGYISITLNQPFPRYSNNICCIKIGVINISILLETNIDRNEAANDKVPASIPICNAHK